MDQVNSHVEVPFGLYFPPVVVDRAGRRIRPGNVVSFEDRGLLRRAHVQGWHSDGLVVVTVEDDPIEPMSISIRHPVEVLRVDEDATEMSTQSNFYVEVSGPSTVLVQCVGTRDLIWTPDAKTEDGDLVLPSPSSFVRPDVSGTQTRTAVRLWSDEVLRVLNQLSMEERYTVVRRELRAPILERVLQESVLPRTLQRLILVATDQDSNHPMDTSGCAELLTLWAEAHGHVVGVGVPDQTRRWVREVVVERVTALPHVIEAVAFWASSRVASWTVGADRIVVVHGGGTPAMNVGVLVAASRHADVIVRHVQVPEPDPVTGLPQSLIEMDLVDMPELGGALS